MTARHLTKLSYKQNWPYLVVVGACWLLYAGLTLYAPEHGNTYHLSRSDIGALDITFMLPILAIWLLAINGAASFKRYAGMIRESADGRGLNTLSIGVMLVVAYFVIQAVLGAIPTYFVGDKFVGLSVLAMNHAPLLLAFIAYGFILAGALQLRHLSIRRLKVSGLATILFPYCLLALLFAWYFYHQLPLAPMRGQPMFGISGKWPFYTLALPYILTWLAGILSITMIAEYARTVSGTIYRRALRDLVRGITGVLGFSILLQLLGLTSTTFVGWTLGPILVFIYLLIALYSVGFIFIYRGAGELTLIEVTL
jgi:hypothetical protein